MSEIDPGSSGNVQTVSFENLTEKMADALKKDNAIKSTYDLFSLSKDFEKVFLCYELLQKYDMIPTLIKVEKKDEESEERRKYANRLFALGRDDEAVKHYNQSIAFAETDEFRAISYANRSAIYFRKGLHKECLRDIQNAKDNNYPKDLMNKLIQRETKSLKLLDNPDYVDREAYFSPIPKISGNPNKKIECASDCVEIVTDDVMGRHVVATRDIKPGEVLAVEKSYTAILLRKHYLTHCYNCLRPSLNLIPCLECTLTMYCGESCRDLAWSQFHKYECPILNTLHDIEATKLHLIGLRVVLCARGEYDKLLDAENNEDAEVFKSESYERIHNLCTNEELRHFSDKLYRSLLAASLFYLLEGTLLKEYSNNSDFDFIRICVASLLYKHLMTVPINMHSVSEFQGNSKIDYDCNEIGCGAYAFMSLLNHSCSGHSTRVFYGTTMVLQALRPIRAGEQVYDNYGFHHAMMGRTERQVALAERYCFTCKCEACIQDWPLYSEVNTSASRNIITADELSSLGRCDRSVVKYLLPKLIKNANRFEQCRRNKLLSFLDNQEIMKQLLGSLGNKNVLI